MKKQKNEHATAQKIIQTAKEVFLTKGFEGSSISDIANKAKISKSLIYHHFSHKRDLWKAVKTSIFQAFVGQALSQVSFPMDSFKSFLKSFVTLRFRFYEDNPEIARLITWQRLENTQEDIIGIENKKFTSIEPQIREFQKREEIRPELDPKMVSYFIMSAASMLFMDKPDFLDIHTENEKKQQFLDMLIESLYLAFAKTSPSQQVPDPTIYVG
ncbi:MAG: TetR/AcrR family transcriptional regulator [Alphaproteobacteria bacterium]|nr:TetR/AcrR family transcriptional regulator [Alphaproteobacteria bacterium]